MLRIQTEKVADKLEKAIRECFFEPDIEKATRASEELEGTPLLAAISTLQRRWQNHNDFGTLLVDFRKQRDFLIRHTSGLRVLVAVRAKRAELIVSSGESVVGPLLEIYKTGEPELKNQTYNALVSLKKLEAQQKLAKLALEHDDDIVRDLVFAAGYEPRDPRDRALFFFLNGHWEKYEALDFDHSLLKAVFKARTKYRKPIIEAARRGGRVELVKIVAGIRKQRRPGQKLPEMSQEEWQLTVDLLLENQRWEEAWVYAQFAPPIWSVPLLRRLGESGWKPEKPAEAALFAELTLLALECKTTRPPLGSHLFSKNKIIAAGSRLNALAIGAGSHLVATAGDQRAIRLWNLQKGELLGTVQNRLYSTYGDTYGVNNLALSRDDKYLAVEDSWQTGAHSWQRQLNLFEVARRQLVMQVQSIDYPGSGTEFKRKATVVFGPGNTLVYMGQYEQITVWDAERRVPITQLSNGANNCFAFSPNGEVLAAGNETGTIRLWRVSDVRRNSSALIRGVRSSDAEINCLAFTPDSSFLAAGSADGRIRLYDSRGYVQNQVFSSAGEPRSIAISPDGLRLASGHNNIIELWSLPGLQKIHRWEAHSGKVMGLAFSADGQQLISLAEDGYVNLWTTRLAEMCTGYIEHASIDDLLYARQRLREENIPPQERDWLMVVETLLGWQFQFEIEVEDWTEIEAGLFDIEIE